ncbi:MAG: hypothetical protein LBF34_00355 [Puniceicoccales bacterium]|jgi:hypothetical protein|nr:hypothetical protein [Puniceicoccales bacterium]
MKQPQEGILEHFQDHIYMILRSRNDFQGLRIASRKRSNLETFCEQLVLEGIGEGLFVSPPLPRKLIENVLGPIYERIDFSVQVIENIITNQTGRSAILIAEKVASLLHLHAINFGENVWTITCRTQDPWTFEGDTCKNVITIHFTTMGSVQMGFYPGTAPRSIEGGILPP